MSDKNKRPLRPPFTEEQEFFISQYVKGRSYAELAAMFSEKFGVTITRQQIGTACHYRGLSNELKSSGKPGRQVQYTCEQLQFLRENVEGLHYSELAGMYNRRFGTNLTRSNIADTCKYHGMSNGLNGGFQPGHTHTNGRRYAHAMPDGSETITKEGYTLVKKDGVWFGKNIVVYEEAHGAGSIPDNHRVIFADGNKQNFNPNNLHCVPVAQANMFALRRLKNESSPELAVMGIALAGLYAKINERKKKDYS
jgi:hypothetical protein